MRNSLLTAKLADNLSKEDQFSEIIMKEIIAIGYRIFDGLVNRMLRIIHYHKIIISFNKHSEDTKGIKIYRAAKQKAYIQAPELV